jgi:hypothetical protein|nr:MAG TPA: hypothetical protein [Caudoviricetes sp.]
MKDYSKYYIQCSDHYLIPKDEFENLLKEFEGISNDLETEDKMGDYLRCEVYRSSLINKQLQQENKILKENAENNDKVVDEVNWQNMLLKMQCNELKETITRVLKYIDSQTRNMPRNGCRQRLSRIKKMLKEASK